MPSLATDVIGQLGATFFNCDTAINHELLVKMDGHNPEAGWVVVFEMWGPSTPKGAHVAFVTTKGKILWHRPCYNKGGKS